MLYETTGQGFIFDGAYDRKTATYEEEAYQQMLVIFEDGMSYDDAEYCFSAPVAESPLNPMQLETQALFDYIVANFDPLISRLLTKEFIKPVLVGKLRPRL